MFITELDALKNEEAMLAQYDAMGEYEDTCYHDSLDHSYYMG